MKLTVKRLLDFIETHDIPFDAEVRFQRIEDVYFEKYDWESIKKEGYFFIRQQQLNDKVISGELDDKEMYPDISDSSGYFMKEEEMEELKDQYIVADSCVKYENDNNLYIDAHY